MAVTQVSICNSALIKCGSITISSIGQNTREARLLNSVWDKVRDELLRSHPWNFAIKRATLSPTATTPDFEYDYEYDLPNDCIRILDEEYSDTDYVIEGRKILSNEATLSFRYIYRNEDVDTWDSSFAETMAWRLAQEISYALAPNSALQDRLEAGFKRSMSEARNVDGSEGILKGLMADEWIRARR